MFCRRVGALYKDPVLIERQKDQIQEEFINFSKTSNMKLLLEKLDEKKGRLPQDIQMALAELEKLCGADPVELARYCHEHLGDHSDWNVMAHPLLKYLASKNRDNEQLRRKTKTVIQNWTPTSKNVAQRALRAVRESPTPLSTNVTRGKFRDTHLPVRRSSAQSANKQRLKK
ncbi:hypothetical protein MP228_002839 [Amoeboaphelidium protococcarum]|nr:hypothetical protein MP228_002839 [Amoeboaphelidium protococcarum]